jgi:putative endopeptidase
MKIKPGDDFDLFVNNEWYQQNTIPDDLIEWGNFTSLNLEMEKKLLELCEDAHKYYKSKQTTKQTIIQKSTQTFTSSRQKGGVGVLDELFDERTSNEKLIIGKFYDLLISREKEVRDIGSLAELLGLIASTKTYRDLFDLMGKFVILSISSFFTIYLGQYERESRDESINYVKIGYPHLNLPDREYYWDEQFITKLKAYEAHLEHVKKYLIKKKFMIRDTFASDIIRVETLFAQADKTNVFKNQSLNQITRTNIYTLVEELMDDQTMDRDGVQTNPQNKTSSIPNNILGLEPDQKITELLFVYFRRLFPENRFKEIEDILIYNVGCVRRIINIILRVGLDTWKNYLIYQTIREYKSFFDEELYLIFFDFYSREMNGQNKPRDQWKRHIAIISDVFGELLGKMYVDKFYDQNITPAMKKMIGNIVGEMRNSINLSKWMSEKTKDAALQKMDNFHVKVGHPTTWSSFSQLSVQNETTLLDFIQQTNVFYYHRNFLNKLNKKVDHEAWSMDAFDINAYYSSNENEIAFPAGFLQPPIFTLEGKSNEIHKSDEIKSLNYGAIGVIIAHEITHGYDSNGRSFDAYGKLHDWWTQEDEKKYKEYCKLIVEQYSQYEYEGFHINGELTQGENIADCGGLILSYRAMVNDIGQDKLHEKGSDGWTHAQRFFISYAKTWRELIRKEFQINLVMTDPHAPAKNRIWCVRNLDQFYDAFNVKKGDAMWLDPKLRVQMW